MPFTLFQIDIINLSIATDDLSDVVEDKLTQFSLRKVTYRNLLYILTFSGFGERHIYYGVIKFNNLM